ncbi:MAG: peptidoglycan editing factor PgeF [Kiloniellaceae bacterium]
MNIATPPPEAPLPEAMTSAALDALPGVRHAFLGRHGGVSGGVYASLNCGFGSDDDTGNVAENRARAMACLGLAENSLVTGYQVHAADVAVVEAPWPRGGAPRVDGMATRVPGIALGILTADCAPVLFADPRARVVGAAHAGWRGAQAGILEAVVAAMVELGARREEIRAAIGPAIGRASYEVGPEFPAPFLDEDAANRAFFDPAPRAGHFLFDLKGYAARRLAGAGLTNVCALPGNTCAEDDRYFSYRRACQRGEPDYGRDLSAICLAA